MNLFDQLDSIIEAAINETMGDERARQKKAGDHGRQARFACGRQQVNRRS